MSVTYRLLDLARRMSRFAREDRERRVVPPADLEDAEDEVGRLSNDLDYIIGRFNIADQNQLLYENLITNSTIAIISKTLQGVITSGNPAAEEVFGYSAAEMIGRSVSVLIPDERLDEESEIIERIS